MRNFVIASALLPLAFGHLLDKRAACNADNCARVLTGTARNTFSSSRVNTDCATFQRATYYPPATTTTITSGSVSTTSSPSFASTTVSVSTIPAYASASCSSGGNPSSRFASACSCASVTKTVITAATPTVTVVMPTPAVPTLCGNAGMEWAYFDDLDEGNSNLDPTIYKTQSPVTTGITNQAYFSANDGTVYGKELRVTLFGLEQRGYLYALETGTYTFAADSVDDFFFAWIGPVAYSGYAANNAQVVTKYSASGNGAASYTMDLVAGNYYPLRLTYNNRGGPGSFNFRVTAPDGIPVLSPSTGESIQIVQYSCDQTTAPRYAPFGQET